MAQLRREGFGLGQPSLATSSGWWWAGSMAITISIVCQLSVGPSYAKPADATTAPNGKDQAERSEPRPLYSKAYSIPDLVLPVGIPAFTETGQIPPRAAKPDFESIIELISTTLSPNSWESKGGKGRIAAFPENLSLVVTQSQGVHEQIHDLLGKLRRLQETQIIFETTRFRVPESVLQKLDLPGKPLTALTANETKAIRATVHGDPHVAASKGPIAILFNGQSAVLDASPTPNPDKHSLQYSLQACASASKESIRVSCVAGLGHVPTQLGGLSCEMHKNQALLIRCPDSPKANADGEHFLLLATRLLSDQERATIGLNARGSRVEVED